MWAERSDVPIVRGAEGADPSSVVFDAVESANARNAESEAALTEDPAFDALRKELQAIYDSDARIPYPSQMGAYWYNFWKDGEHPRGVWRRTSRQAYLAGGDIPWEVVLDVDALGKAEGESWVWHGARCLPPEYRRCLLSLSRGGADAVADDVRQDSQGA